MSELKPHFSSRSFVPRAALPLSYRVNSLRWGAVGGCLEASITAFGDVLNLWELVEYLRCPVRVADEMDQHAWWGFVNEVRVRVGAIEVGATLDSMSNAVAVAYSYVQPGTTTVGQRKTTAWVTDADSVSEYGRKEFLSSQGGMSDAAAIARRTAILASRRYPQGTVSPFGGLAPRGTVTFSGAENSQSATITCKGWWSTLGWRYANVTSTSNVETTQQIADLVTAYGQFLTGTEVDEASGVSSPSFRNGDTDALREIEALLASGGANGRRLLCSVDKDRRLLVREEPSSAGYVSYRMNTAGQLLNISYSPVPGYLPPVGVWCRLADVVPASADVSKMINPELQFIEGATWSSTGGLQPQFRGQPSIEDMLKVLR